MMITSITLFIIYKAFRSTGLNAIRSMIAAKIVLLHTLPTDNVPFIWISQAVAKWSDFQAKQYMKNGYNHKVS